MTEETSSEQSVSGSPVDQIAQLLTEEETPPVKEVPEAEAPEEELGEDEGVEEELEESEEDIPGSGEEDVTWAGVLNVDDAKVALDDDGNFQGVKIKVDGAESQVDLNTLIAGYQTAKSTTQRSQKLAADKKAFDEQSTGALEVFSQKIGEAAQFVDVLQKKLMSDYEGVDWQRLRAENPAEYSATVADFQNRRADVDQITATIKQQQGAVAEQQKKDFETKQTEYFAKQAEATLDLFPQWKDPQVAQTAFAEMREFASKFGYAPEEFDQLADSRAISIIQAAMKAEKASTVAERKVTKPVPKFRKSSHSRRGKKAVSKLDRLVKKAASAKGANKRRAQTAAVAELLISEE